MIVTENEARKAWTELCSHYDSGPDVPTAFPPTVEAVTAVYRHAARKTHPDAGGSAADFARMDRAKCVVLEWLRRQQAAPAKAASASRPCEGCSGRGYTIQASGRPGRPGLRRQCITCHGSGDADYDAHGLHG